MKGQQKKHRCKQRRYSDKKTDSMIDTTEENDNESQ